MPTLHQRHAKARRQKRLIAFNAIAQGQRCSRSGGRVARRVIRLADQQAHYGRGRRQRPINSASRLPRVFEQRREAACAIAVRQDGPVLSAARSSPACLISCGLASSVEPRTIFRGHTCDHHAGETPRAHPIIISHARWINSTSDRGLTQVATRASRRRSHAADAPRRAGTHSAASRAGSRGAPIPRCRIRAQPNPVAAPWW